MISKPGPMGLHEDYRRSTPVKSSNNRAFGFVFFALFSIVGLWPLARMERPHFWLVLLGALFGTCALVRPLWLAPLNRAWTWFGRQLHRIVSPITLLLIFAVVFIPMGVIARVFRLTSVYRRPDPKIASYWLERETPAADSMTRQF